MSRDGMERNGGMDQPKKRKGSYGHNRRVHSLQKLNSTLL